MRRIVFVFLSVISISTQGQVSPTEEINKLIQRNEAEAHLSFLAADEMRGRDTGSPELQIAANYIRTQFKINNIKPAPGTSDYFQFVDLLKSTPPNAGELMLDRTSFKLKDNMLVIEGGALDWNGEFVYVGYGSTNDLEKKNIKGKMVLALAGSKDTDNINKIFGVSRDKFATVKKLGGAGLVEILALPQVPWPALVNYFNQDHWSTGTGELSQPFIWLKPADLKSLNLKENQIIKGSLKIQAAKPQAFKGKNVAGFIEGTDANMKDQFVVMTAHYDHVGVQGQQNEQDSIFNGARDNATGTVALIQAAKYFSKFPPKRSILFIAVTSEEKGLLGSSWYVKHPLVPLKSHVLNINCDGVGYNDKTRITSISLGRTNLDDLIVSAAKAYGLTVGGDPDPREGFYERSDQVSFAKEGIPAIKMQPGLAQMDQSIWDYYHRPADEVGSLDLDYITTFYRTFVHAVQIIVNDPRTPQWSKGDKFEEAAEKLYGK
jgi:hypothetical protein